MKLVFISNYLNHHQKSLAEEFMKIYEGSYRFIAMTPFDSEKIKVGYVDMNQADYVLRAYESPEAMQEARKLLDEAECVIVGGIPVSVISNRLKLGKLTFMYSERFFKGPVLKDIIRFFKYRIYSGGRAAARDIHSKFYLLCAGAFVAWDYNTCGLFRNKAYRWGYFPEAKHYDIDDLISRKREHSILWVGRFIDRKYPDMAVTLAKNLKDMGLHFNMKLIGAGDMQDKLEGMVKAMNLEDCVEFTIGASNQQVREEMEESEIFIFTSDRVEGWGVVMNEAMNSGCAVVAGSKIGSLPYLVRDGHNGIIFRDRDIDDLTQKVAALLKSPDRTHGLGRAAYDTINSTWNPEEAAIRFVKLSEALRSSDKPVSLWQDGPCSVAPLL